MDNFIAIILAYSPCILCVGALLCWLNTRKLSALIMMFGFIPSTLSVTGFELVMPYLEYKNGLPTGVAYDVYTLTDQIISAGTAVGVTAFVLLPCR